MKIIISEDQFDRIMEVITDDKVICGNCGWSWDLVDGGDDLYNCHKCGHNNSEDLDEK